MKVCFGGQISVCASFMKSQPDSNRHPTLKITIVVKHQQQNFHFDYETKHVQMIMYFNSLYKQRVASLSVSRKHVRYLFREVIDCWEKWNCKRYKGGVCKWSTTISLSIHIKKLFIMPEIFSPSNVCLLSFQNL